MRASTLKGSQQGPSPPSYREDGQAVLEREVSEGSNEFFLQLCSHR